VPIGKIGSIFCILALVSASAFAQTVFSNLVGTVTDPAKAIIPGAEIQLTNRATGAVRTAQSNEAGIFRFTGLTAATYSLRVQAAGFKTFVADEIALASSETRDMGKIALQIGAVSEQIQVTAEVTPVQTASSEVSSTISGYQLQTLALKGRDLFGFLALIPGVVDTGTRDVTSPNAIGGLSINGGGQRGFLVDGVADMDTGSNGTVHYEPNMDSIGEIRVLTSNYQAEYGRQASGTISVVTKSGTRDFHGTGYWNKRHEQFNAKNFFDNRNNIPKTPYRYDVYGYTIGGPAYIPKLFNKEKRLLFFFFSQEYTKQLPVATTTYARVPTLEERKGDFSKSYNNNGQLLIVRDPVTRVQFPGNKIPSSYAPDPVGLAILNFFPEPNRCDVNPIAGCWEETDSSQTYRRNYRYTSTGPHPRRNDVLRFDGYPIQKLNLSYRWANDFDDMDGSYNMQFYVPSEKAWLPYTEKHPNPGHGHVVSATYSISRTLVNEFIYGQSWNSWDYYIKYEDQLARDRMNNPPHWFDENDPVFSVTGNRPGGNGEGNLYHALYIPAVSFGAPSATQTGFSQTRPYTNFNNIYSVTDNISWILGRHSLKLGIYWERTAKIQYAGLGNYLGSYSFGYDSNSPYDTGNGIANAYLGIVNQYSEGTRVVGDFVFRSWEGFVQDNWRVHPRLTLELGLRLSYLKPQENENLGSAAFVPSSYDPANAPRLFYPGYDAAGKQIAIDRLTGTTANRALVGTFVPCSVGGYAVCPDINNGMEVADGKNPNMPLTMFTVPSVALGPRFGFAWDVFGNGKTAVRGGFGRFFNRGDGNQIMPMNGNPPVTRSSTLYFTTISGVSQVENGAYSPLSPGQSTVGEQKLEESMSASFGIQQDIGYSTVVDVSWVANLRRHIRQNRNINHIPKFSQYDPANADPWSPYTPKRSLSDLYFRPYQGWDTINMGNFEASTYYHSMQLSVRRRMTRDLSYSVAYTWSKTMEYGIFNDFSDTRGKRPTGNDHVMAISYTYNLPGLGRRLGSRVLSAVLDGWMLSGITRFMSGSYMSPTFSWSGTTTTKPAPWMTGSADGARLNLLGNPTLPKDQRTFDKTFDTAMFAPPTPCSWENQTDACFGNMGYNILKGPGMNNWDMTFSKQIPLGLPERFALRFRAEMYNIFNHTQFSGVDTSAEFNVTTLLQTDAQFGRYTSARAPRQMSFSLRFEF